MWKKSFGKGHYEEVMEVNGEKHFADVYTKSEVVIELQNSPIDPRTIQQREKFYGEKMLWVLNGSKFEDNFYFRQTYGDNFQTNRPRFVYQWKWIRECWNWSERHLFIDFKDKGGIYLIRPERMGEEWDGTAIKYTKKEFIEYYGGDYNHFFMNEDKIYPEPL